MFGTMERRSKPVVLAEPRVAGEILGQRWGNMQGWQTVAGTGTTSVTSFNTRIGDVVLLAADVRTAGGLLTIGGVMTGPIRLDATQIVDGGQF
jgi:hypothetical protein